MTDPTLAYYAQPGPMTDLSAYADHLRNLPDNIPQLCRIVQGLMVHLYWADRYEITATDQRKRDANIRPAAEILKRALELDARPLTATRPPEKRVASTCRDFATLLTAILRHKGIPARARVGFGMYFLPNKGEDHWVCEYWDSARNQWVFVDAQIDDLQRGVLGMDFDTIDVPRDQFLPAGVAWQRCRAGDADSDRFGFGEWSGLAFIEGNIVRDLAALNKMELLPWDFWGSMQDTTKPEFSTERLARLDHIAALTTADPTPLNDICAAYKSDEDFRVPDAVLNWFGKEPVEERVID